MEILNAVAAAHPDWVATLGCEYNVMVDSRCAITDARQPVILHGTRRIFQTAWRHLARSVALAAKQSAQRPVESTSELVEELDAQAILSGRGCAVWDRAHFPGWWIGTW